MNVTGNIVAIGLSLAISSTVSAQTADKSQFKAHINLMPGPSPKNNLIVTGIVSCPTAGWKETLVEAKPPGINPSILILEVKSSKPSGLVSQVITPVQVRFDKTNADKFKNVTIRGAGPEFTLEVEEVH